MTPESFTRHCLYLDPTKERRVPRTKNFGYGIFLLGARSNNNQATEAAADDPPWSCEACVLRSQPLEPDSVCAVHALRLA